MKAFYVGISIWRRALSAFFMAMAIVASPVEAWASSVWQDVNADTLVNQMVNGKRHGLWRIQGAKGKLEVGSYVNGKKNGVWTTTRADGSMMSQVTWDNGKPYGKSVYYHADGTVMESGFWNVDHWEGAYERFYPNGNKSCAFEYDNDGSRTGVQVYFHENGKKMYEGKWSAGKIAGAVTVYNEQGVKILEREYDNSGKFQGTENADDSVVAPTANRKFEGSGSYTLYNADGGVAKRGTFKNGVLMNGEVFIYNDNGELDFIDHYKAGKLVKHEKHVNRAKTSNSK